MSNNSAAKATLDVYQALFAALDDYLSRTRFLEGVEMHDFTREVFMFFLDRGFDPEIDLTINFNWTKDGA